MSSWKILNIIGILGLVMLGSLALPGCPSSPQGHMYWELLDLAGQDGTGGEGDVLPADAVADISAEDVPFGELIPDLIEQDHQCFPCVDTGECGDGGCVQVGNNYFCLSSCDPAVGCNQGFHCEPRGIASFCVPDQGECPCDGMPIDESLGCKQTNEAGTCQGVALCEGVWSCLADEPSPEVCDYKDNDCDEEVDEDFKVGEYYFSEAHCGECNHSCSEVEHGQAACSFLVTPPACRVVQCDPGYISLDGQTCIPAGGMACVECQTNEDCSGGRCIPLGDPGSTETFCMPRCIPDCDPGYHCEFMEDGLDYCIPDSGTCSCTPETLGQPRGCKVGNQYGQCLGLQLCLADGYGPCDARTPLPEECNGKDENCDGLVDEGLPDDQVCYNPVPGLGSCAGVLVCEGEGGWKCNAPLPQTETCDYLDNDCDGKVDDDFRDPVTGLYITDKHCGFCDNDCGVFSWPHASSKCLVSGAGPDCGMVCDSSWVDTNGLEEDGCECHFLSENDPPDGIDQNCDGIDGEPDNAVFVSQNGDDTNPGTPDAPVRTVTKAMSRAQDTGKKHIYVTKGQFHGRVVLASGVQIYCGFPLDFSSRNIELNLSELLPSDEVAQPGTINGYSLGTGSVKSRVDGCTIAAGSGQAPGQPSYAVYLKDCGTNLELESNIIIAGNGGNGSAGQVGQHGDDGTGGAPGVAAYDLSSFGECNAQDWLDGGTGGQKQCGNTIVSGGSGGTSICPDYDEYGPAWSCPISDDQSPDGQESGVGGLPGLSGGAGGAAGYDALHTIEYNGFWCGWDYQNCGVCHVTIQGSEGRDGKQGLSGANGMAGIACNKTAGTVTSGDWVAGFGGAGGPGFYGSGGGGGGAAGGVEVYGCEDVSGGSDIGGSGGGGGSGGCGATGGTGGQGGGASIGVYMTWLVVFTGAPKLVDNEIYTGHGGMGGAGGGGGVGGTGGYGGSGGSSGSGDTLLWCAGEGGTGGHGGNGGSGGGGGGGCGGPAFGIVAGAPSGSQPLLTQALTTMEQGNQILLEGGPGAGGIGGDSKGQKGQDGPAGLHKASHLLTW